MKSKAMEQGAGFRGPLRRKGNFRRFPHLLGRVMGKRGNLWVDGLTQDPAAAGAALGLPEQHVEARADDLTRAVPDRLGPLPCPSRVRPAAAQQSVTVPPRTGARDPFRTSHFAAPEVRFSWRSGRSAASDASVSVGHLHGVRSQGAYVRSRHRLASCLVGITKSAPARMPVGQRVVIVLRRV